MPRSAHFLGVHAGGGASGVMQLPRSKSMNSMTFSCGVSALLSHSLGNVAPSTCAFETWKSL